MISAAEKARSGIAKTFRAVVLRSFDGRLIGEAVALGVAALIANKFGVPDLLIPVAAGGVGGAVGAAVITGLSGVSMRAPAAVGGLLGASVKDVVQATS